MIEGPDQPRSWAIAIAACVISTLLSGISWTTGLFYIALIETYGVSRLQANLPFTVRNVVRNLSGPVVGAIGQRYGPRVVTIVGGVFAALGITLCTFAPNVAWITVFWGGVHGLGVALAITLCQVIVPQYFLKYRATASGLALSGECLGSLVLPILLKYLLLDFGLSGTFLVMGGLLMHVLPAAIMLKEPPWIRRQRTPKPEKLECRTIIVSKKVTKPPNGMSAIRKESNGHADAGDDDRKRWTSGSPSRTQISGSCKQPEKDVNSPTTFINGLNGVDNPAYVGSVMNLSAKNVDQVPDNLINGERRRNIPISGESMTIPVSVSEEMQETSIYKSILKVCRDPMFHMISLSLAAFAFLFDPAMTVIVDYLMDKGLKEDIAKYFITMLSMGDLVGRLGFSWVIDRNYLSLPRFMMLLQVVQGVCFLLLPFCFSFYTLMGVVFVFGVMSGLILVMYPILVGKYLKSVQSFAFGSISFFSGLLSFAVPPLIGYFRDKVGSYDGMFFVTGGLSTVIGLSWLLEPLLVKLGKRQKKEKSVTFVTTT